MKTKAICILTLIFLSMTTSGLAQSYDKLWKDVHAAEEKDLPKSVIATCNLIVNKATKEHNSGQLMTAYFYRAKNKNTISPDSFYVQIKELEQWALKAQKPIEQMTLHSILANAYASYADENFYELKRRTNTSEIKDPQDIREWTRIQFHDAVMKHVDASLSDIALLRSSSTKDFTPFTSQEWTSEYYHHDMLHLLSRKAIEALHNFKSVADNKQEINSKVEHIYQTLQQTYRSAGEENAWILISLDKLAEELAITSNTQKYENGLDQLLKGTNVSNPVRTEIYLKKIALLQGHEQQTAALKICDEVLQLYPKYNRINLVQDVRNKILRPSIHVTTGNSAYPQSTAKIFVSHKNADGFTLYFYKVPGTDIPDRLKTSMCTLTSSQHFELKRPKDYLFKKDSFEVTMPDCGIYLLKVKADGESKENEEVNATIRISRLMVLDMKIGSNTNEIVVLDKKSGTPVSGVTLLVYDANRDKLIKQSQTDNQGKATFSNIKFNYIKATKDNDIFMDKQSLNNYYYYKNSDKGTDINVSLLTDRSIYRPGQTIHVKGIAYSQKEDQATVIANKTYKLTLKDANFQNIAEKKVTTNEYGSFTTDFSLPSSCLNGIFSLSTEKGFSSFRVEEYKRPTFEVTTNDIKSTYSLGDTVYVKGNAKTFSGIPVSDTYAKYKIRREKWLWWWSRENQIITTDSVKINADGSFMIPVILKNKSQETTNAEDTEDENEESNQTEQMEINDNSYYTFTVMIDVTTQAGETQSGEVVLAAGSHSLVLGLSGSKQICKDKSILISVDAKNLLQKPVDTSVDYTLAKLKEGKAGEIVDKGKCDANKEIAMNEWQNLPSGKYLLTLTANDSQGRKVERKEEIILFSVKDKQPAENTNIWYYAENSKFDAQHPAKFYFGTSCQNTTVLMDVFNNGQRIESKELKFSNEVKEFNYPYQNTYGDGIDVNFCYVKDGICYQKNITFEKTVPDMKLKMKWNVFRDKLRPGQKEEWSLNILTPNNKPAQAEMLGYLYDASIDKIYQRPQYLGIGFNRYIANLHWSLAWMGQTSVFYSKDIPNYNIKSLAYDNFDSEFEHSSYSMNGGRVMLMSKSVTFDSAAAPIENEVAVVGYGIRSNKTNSNVRIRGLAEPQVTAIKKTDKEVVRSNFAETAFFYPQLRTDAKGNISIAFTLPESLTRWKFNGYAHTKEMMTGLLSGETTASKDFMLTPNLPRFVRSGDQASVSATVANMTDNVIPANVKLELFDPMTDQIILTQSKPVTLQAKGSGAVGFDFTVTDRYDILGVRMVADGASFSDGEQHILPVLSDKVMLTEAIPLPIRGNQTKTFSLEKLFNNHSTTATNRKLTVEYTGNPAWYAVQALPSLALPTSDNAVCWATVLYANSLASYIAHSMPRIKAVIDSWKANGGNKETLLSNLQKNQELKNILLDESPWVLEAKSEQEQKERLGTLFDLNNLQNNNRTAIEKLKQLQDGEGAWSWFKGMSGNRYMTEYVLRLNARLQMLTGEPMNTDMKQMQSAGFKFLHKESQEEYKWICKAEREGQKIKGISYPALRYLYLITITGEPVPSAFKEAYNYFLSKVNEVPASQDMQEKSLAAIILDKAGKKKAAQEYIESIQQHLTNSEELGMYFDFNQNPFEWGCMHLTAHTAAIEAMDRVAHDNATVDEMNIWLLKQKQTQQWDTPVSTTDAIYALLERGTQILANQGNVNLSFAGNTMNTTDKGAISGLGYIKQTFSDNQAIDTRSIKVEKKDAGIAWGAVYAQFKESIAHVKQQGSSAFNVKKQLYVKRTVNNVEELQPIRNSNTLKVGDVVVARLTIQLDRKMDFVQLKEQRGGCFEPMTALSGYHWSAGTGYYEEIKDASTNFFFDSLSKGVYVLEINYRVSHTGNYEVGLSTLQCAYAPEFATHSDSMRIEIKP